MKNLSKREKVLLITAIVLIALYGYIRFFISSSFKDIYALNQSINNHKNIINEANTNEILNEKYKTEVLNKQDMLKTVLKALPATERDAEIADDLKALADKNEVEISKVEYAGEGSTTNNNSSNNQSENEAIKGLKILQVNLHVYGDYESIMSFIDSLESAVRVSEIISITMDRNSGINSSKDNLSGNLSINYYYLPSNVK